jgi:hypothetical protein
MPQSRASALSTVTFASAARVDADAIFATAQDRPRTWSRTQDQAHKREADTHCIIFLQIHTRSRKSKCNPFFSQIRKSKFPPVKIQKKIENQEIFSNSTYCPSFKGRAPINLTLRDELLGVINETIKIRDGSRKLVLTLSPGCR